MKYRNYIKGQLINDIKVGEKVIVTTEWNQEIEGTWQIYFNGMLNNKPFHILVDNKPYYMLLQDIKGIKVIEEEDGENMSKKEQLLNELEQIKKEFKEKIKNVQKQIKKEDNKNKWWTPKEAEIYWYVDFNGEIVKVSFGYGHSGDHSRINNLNYYKTKEEAERQSFEELLHRKLKKFAFENNESEIDWNNHQQLKYRICYSGKLDIFDVTYFKDFGQIYFSSKKIAEKAIEEFKSDLIRYFTSDK